MLRITVLLDLYWFFPSFSIDKQGQLVSPSQFLSDKDRGMRLNSLRPRRNRRYNADDIFKCIFLRENVWIPTKISLRPRRNRRYNADDIFKCIFLRENVWIPTKISLKFVPKGPINNIPALVQIMAWRPPGDKPLSEPMMVSLLTHIYVTRPQWVNALTEWWHLTCQ